MNPRRLTTACSRRPSQSSNLHTQICRLSGARLSLVVRRHCRCLAGTADEDSSMTEVRRDSAERLVRFPDRPDSLRVVSVRGADSDFRLGPGRHRSGDADSSVAAISAPRTHQVLKNIERGTACGIREPLEDARSEVDDLMSSTTKHSDSAASDPHGALNSTSRLEHLPASDACRSTGACGGWLSDRDSRRSPLSGKSISIQTEAHVTSAA